MPHVYECFNCGRRMSGLPRFTIVMPVSGETLPGGHVCDRCLPAVGQEIRVYPLATSDTGRAFFLA